MEHTGVSKYSVYSDFDIEMHKKTFVNYLEVLIDRTGKIHYAVPSHQELAIKMACEELGLTRNQLNKKCPQEYYFNFLEWVLGLTESVSVWNDFYMGNPNVAQMKSLIVLKNSGLYKGRLSYEVN